MTPMEALQQWAESAANALHEDMPAKANCSGCGGWSAAAERLRTEAESKQVGGDHYTKMEVQPWDVMEAILSPAEFTGYLKGNIIKYSMRSGHKPGSDDTGKARHYMQKLQEVTQQTAFGINNL